MKHTTRNAVSKPDEKAAPAKEEFIPDMPFRVPDERGVLADQEERDNTYGFILDGINDPRAVEALASYLCNLRSALWEETEWCDSSMRVSAELGYFLEYTFKRSKAYEHAFTIYTGRFNLLATTPEALLESVLKIQGEDLKFRDMPGEVKE